MPVAMFDLDGTLMDQKGAARQWARIFAGEWSLGAGACEVVASALAERRPKGEVFEHLVDRFSLPTSATEVWESYRSAMPSLVRCTDEDRAALQDLKREGWVIGVVSNGMADNQVGKLRNTGIADLVDGWVISSEVGVRKPDPAIFHELARRLECRLEGWMIGDSLEVDVAGGAAVGLSTAWINPGGAATSEVTPTITASTVARAVDRILG